MKKRCVSLLLVLSIVLAVPLVLVMPAAAVAPDAATVAPIDGATDPEETPAAPTDPPDNSASWLPDVGSWFTGLGSSISDGLAALGNFILDGLVDLFVPREDYFTSKITALEARFSFYEDALSFGDSIGMFFKDLGHSSPPVLEFTLDAPNSSWWQSGPVPIQIDFAWYAPWKPYVDVILGAFILLQYFYRLYLGLPGIISGASGFIFDGFRFNAAWDRETDRINKAANRDPDGDYLSFLKKAQASMKKDS